VLTFIKERRLAEVFALILATIDEPARVGAVCIAEQPNHGGFFVRFAMNSGTLQEKDYSIPQNINAAMYERKPNIFKLNILECVLIMTDQQWQLLTEIVKA